MDETTSSFAPPDAQEIPGVDFRIEHIYGNFPRVTTTPTWTPRTFQQSIALDTSAGRIYYYDFTNNVWKSALSFLPRVGTTTSSATPTINTDLYDCYSITAQSAAITSFTTNLSGTPHDFQRLIIRIKDDGTARAITWGASFVAKGTALPTTTVISKLLTVGFLYDSVAGVWECVASQQET